MRTIPKYNPDRELHRKLLRIQKIKTEIARYEMWIAMNEAQIARGEKPEVEQLLRERIVDHQRDMAALEQELSDLQSS